MLVFGLIVAFMVNGRHAYREKALASAKAQQRESSAAWEEAREAAAVDERLGVGKVALPAGQAEFTAACSGCHVEDKALVGPSLVEIRGIYAGKPEGIVAWAKAPGKKRPGMAMPAMAHISDTELNLIALWMLVKPDQK